MEKRNHYIKKLGGKGKPNPQNKCKNYPKQLAFNFKLSIMFNNEIERKAFLSWSKSLYNENCWERRKFNEIPYISYVSYLRANYEYLFREWKREGSLTLSQFEIS